MAIRQLKRRFSPAPTDKIFTVPNVISMLRIVSIPFITALVMHHHLFASLVVLAASCASDGVDGYIARRYNQVTKLGQLLDPIADRLLIICSMLALAWVGIVPWWVLVLVALREVVLGIQILCLAQFGYGPLPVHFVGKAATAMLMITVPVFIVSEMGSGRLFNVLHYGGDACAIWGCTLYWIAGFIYIHQGVGLIRQELAARSHGQADGPTGAKESA